MNVAYVPEMQTLPAMEVIVLPATKSTIQEKKRVKKIRVAAYCRVSTDQEEQLTSYEAQIEYYTNKIESNPEWKLVEIFADEGITGTSAEKRKEFFISFLHRSPPLMGRMFLHLENKTPYPKELYRKGG